MEKEHADSLGYDFRISAQPFNHFLHTIPTDRTFQTNRESMILAYLLRDI
jgi:hypothetical protein